MSTRARVLLLTTLMVGVVAGLLFLPVFPWSARWNHKLDRILAKGEMSLARLRGKAPRLATIEGTVDIPGAAVEVLDSRSGLASLADSKGTFTLPGVMWYPGAAYSLIVSTDEQQGYSLKIRAPDELPPDSEFNVGLVDAQAGRQVKLARLPGRNSITYESYDLPNDEYYRDIFTRLTTGRTSDDAKISAVNSYVATKLNYAEDQWELGSPRRVLDGGSKYCGHLAEALATVLTAGDYTTRMVDICDRQSKPDTHVVVEVSYGGAWHLYDPTFGVRYQDSAGQVVSYRQLRFDQSFIPRDLFRADFRAPLPALPAWMPDAYSSGYHHFYSIQK